MLAALLGTLSLFNAVPAKAQNTNVWSATLTVAFSGNFVKGCVNTAAAGARCSETNVLTSDSFTYSGVNYEVVRAEVSTTNVLFFRLNKAIPSDLKAALTLNVGNRQFALADATTTSFSGSQAQWNNTGLSWSVGDTVQLSLVSPPPSLVNVWLSLPASLSVNEGESITVTAHISQAPTSNVTIPIRFTVPMTGDPPVPAPTAAEDDDYVRPSPLSITINAGQTTGTITIMTNHDDDTLSESLYVEIDPSLDPSIGSRVNPYEVGFTIIDDDRSTTTTTTDPSPPTSTPTNQPTDRQTSPALSSDATLSNIEIEEASLDFDPDTYTYTVNVYGVRTVILTPTANHPDAEITVNGNTVQSGSSAIVALDDDGETTIEIEVTAENGTTKTYTLTVMYCPKEEREILSMFHDLTEGDMWEEDRGWNTEDDLRNWHGVRTENGRVTALSLPENRLSGEVPEALRCFGGLEELRELDLSYNSNLEGDLPRGLEDLNNLGVLDIKCTGITVPEELEEWALGLGEGFRRVCPPDEMVSAQGGGGCAVGTSQERVGTSALLVAILMLLALSRGLRACSD